MGKPLNLDIILPCSFDLNSNEIAVENYKEIKNYEPTEICYLTVFMESEDNIIIDYHSETFRLVLTDLFPYFENSCTIETFISKQNEIARLLDLTTSKEPFNLDVILENNIEISISEVNIGKTETIKLFDNTEECFLTLFMEDKDSIVIDYHSEALRLVLTDLFPEFDNICSVDTFVKKQYEIATLLKLDTTDM